MRSIRMMLVVVIAVCWMNRRAEAWGPEGHGIIGVIAEHYLTPNTREQLEELLDEQRICDPEISCWPDIIRGTEEYDEIYPNNGKWHYIDWDVSLRYSKEFELTPPEGEDHLVAQITRWQQVLASPKFSREKKLDALRFLVHFVGDVHQPLHCAYRYGDMGGNMLPVNSFSGTHYSFDADTPMDYPPSLHSVWDTSLVLELTGSHRFKRYARNLRREIKKDDLNRWQQGEPMDWAVDSYWIARKKAYRWTNGQSVPFKWSRPGMDLTSANYIDSHLPLVSEQLKKGGVRLARLLNEALDPEYVAPAPPAAPEDGKQAMAHNGDERNTGPL